MRYFVIPNLKEKEKYIELSKKYHLGFEYISQLDDKTTILIEISDYNKALNSIKYLKENSFMK